MGNYLEDLGIAQFYTDEETSHLVEADQVIGKVPSPQLRAEAWRKIVCNLWDNDEVTILGKLCYITNKDGEIVPLRANLGQRRFHERVIDTCRSENRPIRGIVLKARQIGFSTYIQAWQWLQCYLHPNRKAYTVNFDIDSAEELFGKNKFIEEQVRYPLPKERDRGLLIHYKKPHRSIAIVKTQRNTRLGRSETPHHGHLSEVPMWDTPDETCASFHNAVPRLSFTSIFHESTAKGAYGYFYDLWNAASEGLNDFVPFFAPWYWEKSYSLPLPSNELRRKFEATLTEDDVRYMRRHDLSMEQMHWRAWCIRNECGNSVLLFRQEYPADAEEAFLTSGMPAFDPESVEALKDGIRDPYLRGEIIYVRDELPQIQETPRGPLRIWDDPIEDGVYVIGADIAEGKVRDRTATSKRTANYLTDRPDYTAAVVLELETASHVATWHGWRNTTEFSYALAALGFYYNTAMLVVESNNMGIAVVENLYRLIQYPNLYRSKLFAKVDAYEGTDIGWRTTVTSRPILIAKVENALADGYAKTRDERLVREMRTMQIDETGVPRAKGKDKDDTVFAYGLSLQGRAELLTGTVLGKDHGPRHQDSWIWDRIQQKHDRLHSRRSRPVVLGRGLGLGGLGV